MTFTICDDEGLSVRSRVREFGRRPVFAGWLICLIALTAIACTPTQARPVTPQPGASSGIFPVPADLAGQVETALRVGRSIYDQDQYASRASDLMLAATAAPPDDARGWVVTHERDAVIVTFVREGADGPHPYARVTFGAGFSKPTVTGADPDEKLLGETAVMFAALQSASKVEIPHCTELNNAVVLPGTLLGEKGWLVYLMPATTTPGLVLVGGYHRVRVSEDGRKVESVTRLTLDCLTVELTRDGIPAFTDHKNKVPIETHVFLSLLHKKPMLVGNQSGLWQVEANRVLFGGSWEQIRVESKENGAAGERSAK
jgi:hypothetical protein